MVAERAPGVGYATSTLRSKLSAGLSYTIVGFGAQGDLIITVDSINTSSTPRVAFVRFEYGAAPPPTNPPAPTFQPTFAPTPFPTPVPPTVAPTPTPPTAPVALCGTNPAATLNNGICEAGENCVNAPNDCSGTTGGKQQNRFCCHGGPTSGIDYATLCTDSRCNSNGCELSTEPVYWCCGDGVCAGGGETNSNCPEDCPLNSPPPSPEPTPIPAPTPTAVCSGRNAWCTSNQECCSGICKNNGKCGAPPPADGCSGRNAWCVSNQDCCSGICKNNRKCS